MAFKIIFIGAVLKLKCFFCVCHYKIGQKIYSYDAYRDIIIQHPHVSGAFYFIYGYGVIIHPQKNKYHIGKFNNMLFFIPLQ